MAIAKVRCCHCDRSIAQVDTDTLVLTHSKQAQRGNEISEERAQRRHRERPEPHSTIRETWAAIAPDEPPLHQPSSPPYTGRRFWNWLMNPTAELNDGLADRLLDPEHDSIVFFYCSCRQNQDGVVMAAATADIVATALRDGKIELRHLVDRRVTRRG